VKRVLVAILDSYGAPFKMLADNDEQSTRVEVER